MSQSLRGSSDTDPSSIEQSKPETSEQKSRTNGITASSISSTWSIVF